LQSREQIDALKADVKSRYWAGRMVDNVRLGKEFEAVVLKLYAQAQDGLAPTSQRLTDELQLEPLSFGRQGTGIAAPIQKLETVEPKETKSQTHIENDSDDEDDTLPTWVKSLKRGNKSARLANLAILQHDVIGLIEETPLVIDVGAKQEGTIGFETLVDEGLAKLLGFEPDPASFVELENSSHRQFLPLALGDGGTHELCICNAAGMNSLLTPNDEALRLFPGFGRWGEVKSKLEVNTQRLDDIPEARLARFAKLDVQGAELMILQNGTAVLENIALLQLESSPSPIYHDEPTLFDVGKWLYEQGFVLHTFSNENKRSLKPYGTEENPYSGRNHIFQVDAVFMPNPLKWDRLSTERLKALAFFAHAMYRSFDVTMLALDVLDRRDGGQRVEAYQLYLDKAALDA
jgi:FkbM family methyltransferase